MKDDQLNYFFIDWLLSNKSNHGVYDSLQMSKDLQEQIDRIGYIHPDELRSMKGTFMEFKINSDIMSLLLTRIEEKRTEKKLIERAIQLGATNDLMYKYVGMSPKDCSEIRRRCGQFKFKRNDQVNENHFFKVWQEEVSDPDTPSLDDLVRFSENNQMPISQIWRTMSL